MRWEMQCGGMGKESRKGKERKGKGAASDNQTAATPKYIIDRGWERMAGEGVPQPWTLT